MCLRVCVCVCVFVVVCVCVLVCVFILCVGAHRLFDFVFVFFGSSVESIAGGRGGCSRTPFSRTLCSLRRTVFVAIVVAALLLMESHSV
jgi:hypothetical protein